MDIYLLNPAFSFVHIIENFQSFIWTERASGSGDFELVVPAGGRDYTTFVPGRYIHIKESRRLMIIESSVITHGKDGSQVISIKGRSLESLLEQRVITTTRKYSNTVAVIATQLVRDICVDGSSLSPSDIIPGLEYESPPSSSVRAEADVRKDTLYKAVKDLCDLDNLSFRILFYPDDGNRLVFQVIRGTDRSDDVVFSEDVDNLTEYRHLRSIEHYKNAAYVWNKDRTNPLIVYAVGAVSPWLDKEPGEVIHTGIYRRVLSVNADDIDDATDEELQQRGREALVNHNYQDLTDGEAIDGGKFRYESHYFMNDLVRISRGIGGPSVKARVVEHIWSIDPSGVRAYPTFEYVDNI